MDIKQSWILISDTRIRLNRCAYKVRYPFTPILSYINSLTSRRSWRKIGLRILCESFLTERSRNDEQSEISATFRGKKTMEKIKTAKNGEVIIIAWKTLYSHAKLWGVLIFGGTRANLTRVLCYFAILGLWNY